MILVILFRLSFMKDPPMQSYAWAMLGLCLGRLSMRHLPKSSMGVSRHALTLAHKATAAPHKSTGGGADSTVLRHKGCADTGMCIRHQVSCPHPGGSVTS